MERKDCFQKQSYVFAAFALLPGKVITLSMMTKKYQLQSNEVKVDHLYARIRLKLFCTDQSAQYHMLVRSKVCKRWKNKTGGAKSMDPFIVMRMERICQPITEHSCQSVRPQIC